MSRSAAAVYRRDASGKHEECLGWLGHHQTLLGKGDTADVRIDDLRLDPLHAMIEPEPGEDHDRFRLIDLGSRTGTYLAGKPVSETLLRPGQPFRVGNQTLVLRLHDPKDDPRHDEYRESNPGFVYDPDHQPLAIEKKRGAFGIPTLLTSHDVLEVSLYWGDRLLEVRTFRAGSEITLGSRLDATFGVPLQDPRFSNSNFTLARYRRGSLELHVPVETSGVVWMGADSFSLDHLRHKDVGSTEFRDLKLSLRLGDRADLNFGQLTLSFRFTRPPEKIPFDFRFRPTLRFFQIGSMVVAIWAALLFLFTQTSQEPPVVKLEDLPPQLRQTQYRKDLAKKLAEKQSAIGQLAKDLQGGRAGGEEGRVKAELKTEKVDKGKVADKEPPQKSPQKQAHTGPTHKVENSNQKQHPLDLDRAFKKSAGGQNLANAVGAAGQRQEGNAVAALTDGGFARGTKGRGAGGGGKSVGIGTLQGYSTGGGEGSGDFGTLPAKGREMKNPEAQEEIVIQGGLDPDVIASIIRRYLSQIQHCYEQQLVTNPRLKGKVTVAFTIAGNGSVSSAEVAESSLGSPPTERCITQKIMGWKFPKPRGGGTVGVRYPFLLMSNTGR